MHYLIIDTCVWVSLAKDEFSLIPKLKSLIDKNLVKIVLPITVQSEFDRSKKFINKELQKKAKTLRDAASEYLKLVAESGSSTSEDWMHIDPQKLGLQLSKSRINQIDHLLEHESTQIFPRDGNYNEEIYHLALEKKAPFRNKNSMADADIFFSAVQWSVLHPDEKTAFISYNIRDFSTKEPKVKPDRDTPCSELASELKIFVEELNFMFFDRLAVALNDVEANLANADEVERSENFVSRLKNTLAVGNALEKYRYINDLTEKYEDILNPMKKYEDILNPMKKYEDILNPMKKYEDILNPMKEYEDILDPMKRYEDIIDPMKRYEDIIDPMKRHENVLDSIKKYENALNPTKKNDFFK